MQFLPDEYKTLLQQKLISAKECEVTLGQYKLTLVDVKVLAYDEDTAYMRNADLRRHVPRGLCFAVHDGKIVHVLAGMKKFGYKEDTIFNIAPQDTTAKKYFLEKANGECFHITAFQINNYPFLLMGSKNVHMAVRIAWEVEDLACYSGERYTFAKRMATDMLQNHYMEWVTDYLLENRVTFVAEACSLKSPHIVQYTEDRISFFAITSFDPDELTYVNPAQAREVFTDLELDVVEMSVAETSEEYDALVQKWQNAKNSEGAVVYCSTLDGRIIWVYKLKSDEYTFWRAVRERMKRHCTSAGLMDRIQKLHVAPVNLAELTREALEFNAWCNLYYAESWNTIAEKWPYVKEMFDQVPLNVRDEILAKYDTKSQTKQVQIFAHGVPGCGKTTLLTRIANYYGGRYIDQDMLWGNAKRYHQTARKISEDDKIPLLALGKNHHTDKIRDDVISSVRPGTQVWLSWYHPEDSEGGIETLTATSIARATSRANHPLDASKADMVIAGFSKSYSPVAEDTDKTVIMIDVTASVDDQFRYIQEQLSQMCDLRRREVRAPALYWSIVLDNDSARRVADHPQIFEMVKGYIPVRPLHITLLHMGRQSHDDERRLIPNENVKVQFDITHVAQNRNVVAAVVPAYRFWSANTVPHVTLGTKNGVAAVESNAMLKDAERVVVNPPLLDLSGTITRHD